MARGKGQEVNRTGLAAVFGVALPTVDMWVRAGCPGVKAGAGKSGGWTFDTAEVSKWLQKRAADEAGGTDVADERAVKNRTAAIRMKSEELELAKDMALVAPVEDMERAQAKVFAMLRQAVMTVPARVSLSLVGERSEARIKQVLTAELTEALTKVADIDFDLVPDDEDGDE